MIVIKKQSKELFHKKTPTDNDYQKVIKDPTEVYEGGKLLAVYGRIDQLKAEELRTACQSTKYKKNHRTDGMKSVSMIFGFAPRNTVRMNLNICRTTELSHAQPKAYNSFCRNALWASETLRHVNQSKYEYQRDSIAEDVLPEWVLSGGCFTSGIVNSNNPLQYHYDQGNVKDSWSVMACFKGQTDGGYLVLPEYELAFEMADSTFLAFSGANTLHGVSPIRPKKNGYRYSIVWYPLQQMANCLCQKEEISRFQEIREKIEQNRRAKIRQ